MFSIEMFSIDFLLDFGAKFTLAAVMGKIQTERQLLTGSYAGLQHQMEQVWRDRYDDALELQKVTTELLALTVTTRTFFVIRGR